MHVYEWRQFVQPTITRRGSGTNFVESLTALLYVPYIPDLLGGFFMFAMFAFLGQMLYYAAFRQMTPEVAHKRYALAIFFLPTMVYWPSSVGKDALIALGLGLATWGATSMFVGRWGAGAFSLLVGLGFTGAIRPHIAALFFGGVLIALVAGKAPSIRGGRFVRFVMVVVLIGGLSVAVVQLSSFHGLEISADSFGGFADEVQRRTSQGGSQVSGNPVTSPADIPEAALRVLYRPLLHEARNIQTLLSAIRGNISPRPHHPGLPTDPREHVGPPSTPICRAVVVVYIRIHCRVQHDLQPGHHGSPTQPASPDDVGVVGVADCASRRPGERARSCADRRGP